MTADGDEGAFVDLVERRTDLLELLAEPHTKSEMVASLDSSRSTVDRAIRRLRNAGLVRQEGAAYVRSFAGRVAVQRHRAYRGELRAAASAEPVVAPLSRDADLDVALLDGATATRSEEPTPYRALEPLHDAVAAADDYRGVLPTLDDPRHFRLLYEHVVTEGNPATLTVSGALATALREEFPRRLDVLRDHDGFELRVGPTPEYGLVVTASAGERTATAVVFDGGTVHGTLRNGGEAAVDWAHERLSAVEDGADRVRASEGADADHDGGDDEGGLPAGLEREGFVRLTPSFFAERSVADPATAWRGGLGLAEVNAGYAVDPTTEVDGEPTSMTDHLLSELREGARLAVVGPPGSGKSTTCKRVACEWYRDGGTVFYRESPHEQPFESVDGLVSAVRAADEPLVVVEHCLAPGARAIFDALTTLEGSDEPVAVLLDAEAAAWRDPPSAVPESVHDTVRTVRMPSLLDGDDERLVERFERTVDGDVSVAVDRLRDAVRDERRAEAPDGAAAGPSEPLLLAHRLSGRLEDDGPSGLQAAAAAAREAVAAAGPVARDVGLVANVLNAAGVGVRPEYVHAAVDAPPVAVREGLAALEGTLLFGRDGGDLRTGHASWSVAYLEAAMSEAEDGSGSEPGAADRAGACLTRLLSLADAPDRRAAARAALDASDGSGAAGTEAADGGTTPVLDRIESDPSGWADDTVERLFGDGPHLGVLAPVLGDSDRTALPAACSDETRGWALAQRAEAWLRAGDLDRAERRYERLRTAADDGAFGEDSEALCWRAVHGLGDVARRRGEFETATEAMRSALERAEAAGNERQAGIARMHLGTLAEYVGDLERAERLLTESLDAFEDAGRPGDRADALDNLGIVYRKLGRYDDAEAAHRECLELRRSLGDRAGEERAVHNLGTLARHRGDLIGAERRFREALDLCGRMGSPDSEALELGSLARVALLRGRYDQADEAIERGVALAREVGDRHTEMEFEIDRGRLATRTGDPATGIDRLDRAVELADGVGDRRGESDALRARGVAALAAGDHDRARADLERALKLAEELEYRDGQQWCYIERGRLARAEGEPERAERLLERARTLATELGSDLARARATAALGAVATGRGDPATATQRLTTAVEELRAADAVPWALWATDLLADACVAAGDRSAAAEWCDRAAALARETGLEESGERFAERARSLDGPEAA